MQIIDMGGRGSVIRQITGDHAPGNKGLRMASGGRSLLILRPGVGVTGRSAVRWRTS